MVAVKKKLTKVDDIDALDYYTRSVNKFPLLSKEEELVLAEAVMRGDRVAEDKFIRSNLRLVLKVAHAYRNRGMAFSDVIEEGNLGLIYALKKFSPEKGFRFATYAVWWIRQSIEMALMVQTRTIRLPVHVVKQLSKCMRQRDKVSHESFQTSVSDSSIAEKIQLPLKDVRFLMSFRHNTVSLENRMNSDSEQDLSDFIKDDNNPEDNVVVMDSEEKLERCLFILKPLERAVVEERFGMGCDEVKSLNAIAQTHKITRDQVRRVLSNALKRMREVMVTR